MAAFCHTLRLQSATYSNLVVLIAAMSGCDPGTHVYPVSWQKQMLSRKRQYVALTDSFKRLSTSIGAPISKIVFDLCQHKKRKWWRLCS